MLGLSSFSRSSLYYRGRYSSTISPISLKNSSSRISSVQKGLNQLKKSSFHSSKIQMAPLDLVEMQKKIETKLGINEWDPLDILRFQNEIKSMLDDDIIHQEIPTRFISEAYEVQREIAVKLRRKEEAIRIRDLKTHRYDQILRGEAKLSLMKDINEILSQSSKKFPPQRRIFEDVSIENPPELLSTDAIANAYRAILKERKALEKVEGDLSYSLKEEQDLVKKIGDMEKYGIQQDYVKESEESKEFLQKVRETIEESKAHRKKRNEELKREEDEEERKVFEEGTKLLEKYESEFIEPETDQAKKQYLEKVLKDLISSYLEEQGIHKWKTLVEKVGLKDELIDDSLRERDGGEIWVALKHLDQGKISSKEDQLKFLEEVNSKVQNIAQKQKEGNWDMNRQAELRQQKLDYAEEMKRKAIEEEERIRNELLAEESRLKNQLEGEDDEEDDEGEELELEGEDAKQKEEGEVEKEKPQREKPIFNFKDNNYQLPNDEIKKILPEGLSGNLTKFSSKHFQDGEPILMTTPHYRALRRKLEDASNNQFIFENSGDSVLLLDGAPGTGKSVTITQLVYWARTHGWIVAYIPDPNVYINGSDYFNPSISQSGLYDTPTIGKKWAEYMLKSHDAQLKKIPIKTSFNLEGFSGKTLSDLLKFATYKENLDLASEAFYRFRRELSLVNEYPVLIAIDGINHFWRDTIYGDKQSFKTTQYSKLKPRQLALCNSFMNIEGQGLVNGMTVVATTSTIPDKEFKTSVSKELLENATVLKNWDYKTFNELIDTYLRHDQIQTQTEVNEANRKYAFTVTDGNPREITKYTSTW